MTEDSPAPGGVLAWRTVMEADPGGGGEGVGFQLAGVVSGWGTDLSELFTRELDRLVAELRAYGDDPRVWKTIGGQKNPPGALALHVVGNLRHYVGAGVGDTGYVRDRPTEFTDRDVPVDELIRRVRACRDEIGPILTALSPDALEQTYPGTPPERMKGISTRAFLLHLVWHLGWHVGQINYHRLANA